MNTKKPRIIKAKSCRYRDVSKAVHRARGGDTIQLPEGIARWEQPLSAKGKKIEFIFKGMPFFWRFANLPDLVEEILYLANELSEKDKQIEEMNKEIQSFISDYSGDDLTTVLVYFIDKWGKNK